MTVSTLRPTSTANNTGTVTGAGGDLDVALSDDSDSTYNTLEFSENMLLGFGDLSLPAGAVIKGIAARVRSMKDPTAFSVPQLRISSSLGIPTPAFQVTWTTPTTTTAWTYNAAGITDSAIDGVSLGASLSNVGGFPTTRVHELYLDVTYVETPTLTVDAPTDPVTDSNLPTVTFTPSFDSDGGGQVYRTIKIVTDAQYTAPGFDPDTASGLINTGEVVDSTTSWQVTQVLPDDTYRAYVRVAQVVNGNLHRSAWAFAEFTVNVDLPGTPTIVATADNSNGRITLAITDNPDAATSTDGYELERSLDGGTTWAAVRTLGDPGVVDAPFVVATGVLADAADGTAHAVPLPTPTGGILAGDLLIAVSGMDGNQTFTWPTGWTELKDEAGNGSAVRAGCAWYRAVGGESGTVTVTTGGSEGGGTRILCIRGAHPTTAPEVSTGVSGSGANANPDSLNPAGWGTENTLWIAAMVNDGNVAVTAGPTNYYEFGNTRWANASGAGVATAYRVTTAASDDPGAFTHSAEDTRAWTIGVRPSVPTLTVYDYEAPNGVATQYRARSLHDYSGVWAASPWATDTETWTSTGWWVKHPNTPALNSPVVVRSFQTTTRAGRAGVFQALGSSRFLVVQDKREPNRGTIVLRSDSISDQDALSALLDEAATLLIQGPANSQEPGYVRVLNHEWSKFADMQSADVVAESLEYVSVPSPPGSVTAWS
jgi:hypothetical protein